MALLLRLLQLPMGASRTSPGLLTLVGGPPLPDASCRAFKKLEEAPMSAKSSLTSRAIRIALLAVAAAAVLLVDVDFALAAVDVALPEQRNSVP